jgi:carbonic anhydrase
MILDSAFLLLALSSTALANCLHGTFFYPRETTPDGGVKVSDFGYTGLQGPLNWAGLSPKNHECATGSIQSPINLAHTTSLAPSGSIKIDFPSAHNAEFENLGTTVEVLTEGCTTFEGKEYKLKQFHFHTPSEHRINEEYFPVEMHLVHEAAGRSSLSPLLCLVQTQSPQMVHPRRWFWECSSN